MKSPQSTSREYPRLHSNGDGVVINWADGDEQARTATHE
jgi:hypothetical protein